MFGVRTTRLVAVAVATLCLFVAYLGMDSVEMFSMAIALTTFAAIPYGLGRFAMRNLRYKCDLPYYVQEGEDVPLRIEIRGRLGLLGALTGRGWFARRSYNEIHGDSKANALEEEPLGWLMDWAGGVPQNQKDTLSSSKQEAEGGASGQAREEPRTAFETTLGMLHERLVHDAGETRLDLAQMWRSWAQFELKNPFEVIERTDDKLVSECVLVPLRRGVYHLSPIELCFNDLLGLFEFIHTIELESQLTVVPNPLRVEGLSVWSTGSFGEHQFEGLGAKGSGVEFHGIREYKPGDELRRVHWRSTARHGQLNVIEFEHSRAEDTVIAIDLMEGSVRGEGRYSTLEYGVRIAADIAEQAVSIGSLVRLACAGLIGPASSPARGRDQLYTVLKSLAGLKADQEKSLSEVLTSRMNTINHGADVICIASTVDEGLEQCARQLSPAGIKLQLILVEVDGQAEVENPNTLQKLAAAGIRVTVVKGSSGRVGCRVVTRYER